MKGSLCRLAETSFYQEGYGNEIRERFNPRAPLQARLPPRQAPSSMPYFNPCAPLVGATAPLWRRLAAAGSQPTRLAGATPHVLQVSGVGLYFCHAPLRARHYHLCRTLLRMVFQLTRPLRGATLAWLTPQDDLTFPTRPLRGRRCNLHIADVADEFQPRLLWGATLIRVVKGMETEISTHAPCGARPCGCCPSPPA